MCLRRLLSTADRTREAEAVRLKADSLEQIQPFNSQVHIINGVIGGQDCGAERRKRNAHQIVAGQHQRGLALWRDAHQPAAAVQAGGNEYIALAGNGQSLRTAQPAIPGARVAVRLNGPDGLVRRERRRRDEQRAGGIHGEVIGGYAWLERGVHKDLPLRD